MTGKRRHGEIRGTPWKNLVQEVDWSGLILGMIVKAGNIQQTAKSIGVSQKTIYNWQAGIHVPGRQHAEAMIEQADELGINWLTYRKGIRPIYSFDTDYNDHVLEGPIAFPNPKRSSACNWPAQLFDWQLSSPLGVSASVLTTDARFIGRLCNCGFALFTYKTVRAEARKPHHQPQIGYVDLATPQNPDDFPELVLASLKPGNMKRDAIGLTNSLGMPSPDPKVWMPDVDRAVESLLPGQRLILSVVGSPKKGVTEKEIIQEFVECVRLALRTRAHAVEMNFSCPNAYDDERAVYQTPELAGKICAAVKALLKQQKDKRPLLIKIGYLPEDALRQLVIESIVKTKGAIDGISAINTVATKVWAQGGRGEGGPFFPTDSARETAGVSGIPIRDMARVTVERLSKLRQDLDLKYQIIGMGGVMRANDVEVLLKAGANVVQATTVVMFNPRFAEEVHEELQKDLTSLLNQAVRDRGGKVLTQLYAEKQIKDVATVANLAMMAVQENEYSREYFESKLKERSEL